MSASSSTPSPRVKAQPPAEPRFVNRKPKFPTRYHEMLQPLSPVTTLPPPEASRQQQPHLNQKHLPSFLNVELQNEFHELMRGCKLDDVERFLKQHSENIDINRFSPEGQTPLHEACQNGNLEATKILLQFGANPYLTNRDGFSILHLATFSGNSELLVLVMNLRK